ncbi:hypothetical protein RISK_001001 [Rhodopirellula islandica]|uniref:Uncharacterized protein n=1 Tax=Rhodopirellula islandica TaxID=595434 RepID=A0A0J1BKZ5_RHOIS|nr:hypothetical protein RISK_001001 [Rhodopirellula islandica]
MATMNIAPDGADVDAMRGTIGPRISNENPHRSPAPSGALDVGFGSRFSFLGPRGFHPELTTAAPPGRIRG